VKEAGDLGEGHQLDGDLGLEHDVVPGLGMDGTDVAQDGVAERAVARMPATGL
jgi:hypothetical protein